MRSALPPPLSRASRRARLLLACLLAVAVSSGLLAAPSHALRPLKLTVSPVSATAGTTVTVAAEGFRGRVPGTLRWAGVPVGSFRTDVHGRFRMRTTVPASPTGTLTVSATADGRTASSTFTTLAPVAASTSTSPLPPLTWAPPSVTAAWTGLQITAPGTYDLHSDTDYVITAPTRIDGAVHLRGGRHVVWVGGHIRIPDLGSAPTPSAQRRGLVISDTDATRGNPTRYGTSVPGRVVHIEGLLIDGPHLTEGVNTNAPSAVVQLQNLRVEGVHFRSSDDRDGTAGWTKNHPDVLQTWGSQRELRVDGLSATSTYQGIFLKEDAPDSVLGPMWLRRVDVQAVERTGTDGVAYAGHRMLSWYGARTGALHLDPGTVRVTGHVRSGWNRAKQNPDPGTAFWRGRYLSTATGAYVLEPPPGDAVFTDALGDTVPSRTGSDAAGSWASWDVGPTDFAGTAPGRVYSGAPAGGSYVPAGTAGLSYVSPGYAG